MRRWQIAAVSLTLLALTFFIVRPTDPGVEAFDDAEVELTCTVDGTTFKLLHDGRAFRVDDATGRWHYHATVFDPIAMKSAYVEDHGVTYRIDPDTGGRFEVRRNFREDFEGLSSGRDGLNQLIGPERGWGSLTLQAPNSPTVADYVELRGRILSGEADFDDAIVMPDTSRSHSGTSSLLCRVAPKSPDMITSKASLSCPLVCFRKGDDFWYRAWYFATGSHPSSLLDLECEWLDQHGGIRVFLDESACLLVELKALQKPKFQQPESTRVPFPRNRWVELAVHFHLSDHPDEGHVRVWQDEQLLIDTSAVTLPLARIIYSSLEIGISSHSYGDQDAVLWVDDIEVSDAPLK